MNRFFLFLKNAWMEAKLRTRVLFAAMQYMFLQQGDITPVGRLTAVKISADGTRTDLGLISTKVVTTAGVGFIVDAFQNSVELETMKYHGCGTGAVAESSSDTTLGTEAATRATGSLTEGASANIFKTVGTWASDGSYAITEHGVFSASTVGVLLDRSVFAAINVISGDSIEFTYELTFPAGS